MSAVKGVNRTLADAQATSDRIAKGLVDGRVKVIIDSYEAAALASGSTIKVGTLLPIGAVVNEVILHTDNLQNNTTLAVGDAEVADRYIDAIDHGAAALVSRIPAANVDGRNYTVDETDSDNTDRQVVITTGAGEATGTIKIAIFYSQD